MTFEADSLRLIASFAIFLNCLGILMAPFGITLSLRKKFSEVTGIKFFDNHVNFFVTSAVLVFLSMICFITLLALSDYSIERWGVLITLIEISMGFSLLYVAFYMHVE